jgi:hypothetical protein
MLETSRRARVVAAASLLVAGGAFAEGTFTPEPGIAQTSDELKTDAILSIGLQWRPASHYATEVRFDHLTATGTNVIGLQFQVPF